MFHYANNKQYVTCINKQDPPAILYTSHLLIHSLKHENSEKSHSGIQSSFSQLMIALKLDHTHDSYVNPFVCPHYKIYLNRKHFLPT